jgi:hypothetical protein
MVMHQKKCKTIEYNNDEVVRPSKSPIDGTTIKIRDLMIIRCNLHYFSNKKDGKTSHTLFLQLNGVELVKDAIALIDDEL